jgi:hypothetical protein
MGQYLARTTDKKGGHHLERGVRFSNRSRYDSFGTGNTLKTTRDEIAPHT